MKSLFVFALPLMLLFSCSSEPKKEVKVDEKKDIPVVVEESCLYTIAGSREASLIWTAYKFTNKVGVKGTFDDLYVSGKLRQSSTIPKLLDQTQFYITSGSINSKNEERDPKIIKSFFGNIITGDSIKGQIIEAKGTNRVGKCEANLKFNGVEKTVFLDYTFEDMVLKLKGGFNLEDWNAQDAVAALNEVCEDLHKGEDGVSKLWPNIDIEIESKIKSICD